MFSLLPCFEKCFPFPLGEDKYTVLILAQHTFFRLYKSKISLTLSNHLLKKSVQEPIQTSYHTYSLLISVSNHCWCHSITKVIGNHISSAILTVRKTYSINIQDLLRPTRKKVLFPGTRLEQLQSAERKVSFVDVILCYVQKDNNANYANKKPRNSY